MKKVVLIYIIVLLPYVTFGQTEKQLVPSDLKQKTIVTEPSTLYKGFLRAGLSYGYGIVDKLYNSEGEKYYVPNANWASGASYTLYLEYGITDKLMLDLNLFYNNSLHVSNWKVHWPENNSAITYTYANRARGLGDFSMKIKYQIVPERENKASLTGALTLTAPTGKKNFYNIKSTSEYSAPTGNGYFASEFELIYRKIRYPYSYSGYVTYEYRFRGSKLITAADKTENEFKDGNVFSVGGSFNFHLNEWIAIQNVLELYNFGKNVSTERPDYNFPAQTIIRYQPILVFQVKKFRIGEGFTIPITGKNSSADPQLLILTQYIF